MDTKIKAEWISALRSGEYEQGKGRLATTDLDTRVTSYCCLGVLCEISPVVEQVIPESGDESRPRFQSVEDPEDSDSALLPHSVRKWAGMESWGGSLLIESRGQSWTLPNLNDEEAAGALTFSQIADLIEYFL